MTPDPHYNPECDIYLGIDKGFRNPNVTLWIQPNRKMERVIVLFAHYQVLRTPDENAKIALEIHKARGYGQLTGGWGIHRPRICSGLIPWPLEWTSWVLANRCIGAMKRSRGGFSIPGALRDRVAWSSPGTVPGSCWWR